MQESFINKIKEIGAKLQSNGVEIEVKLVKAEELNLIEKKIENILKLNWNK